MDSQSVWTFINKNVFATGPLENLVECFCLKGSTFSESVCFIVIKRWFLQGQEMWWRRNDTWSRKQGSLPRAITQWTLRGMKPVDAETGIPTEPDTHHNNNYCLSVNGRWMWHCKGWNMPHIKHHSLVSPGFFSDPRHGCLLGNEADNESAWDQENIYWSQGYSWRNNVHKAVPSECQPWISLFLLLLLYRNFTVLTQDTFTCFSLCEMSELTFTMPKVNFHTVKWLSLSLSSSIFSFFPFFVFRTSLQMRFFLTRRNSDEFSWGEVLRVPVPLWRQIHLKAQRKHCVGEISSSKGPILWGFFLSSSLQHQQCAACLYNCH